jgi:putative metallohydrolase (TIGR04338 family)
MSRDNQRSKVYAWERRCVAELAHSSIYDAEFKTLEECAEYAGPIWNKERGRVGRAKIAAPRIERPNRGQRRALAHHGDGYSRNASGKLVRDGGRITLPRWARSRWVILHELAHRLDKDSNEAHGPRFVGILIGLIARWLDYDAAQLMALADEMGVKYHVRTIGVVPVRGIAWHVERVIRHEGPMSEMDLSCHLNLAEGVDVTPAQVRGAALSLIRLERARWLRGKLVLLRGAENDADGSDEPMLLAA